MSVGSVTPTSIAVTWSSGGSEGVSYLVDWTYNGGCSGISGGSIGVGQDRQYTIEGLQEYITYSITVRASNSLSTANSTAVDGTTSEASELILFIRSISRLCVLTTGPSAPPEGVTADGMSTSITVQWGSVPCIHQNGVITEYSVRYGVEGSGSTQTVTATGNGATILDLIPSTNYTVQVAAVNSAGVGEYSDPSIIVNTESKSDFKTWWHL